jgi:hypothetical protein
MKLSLHKDDMVGPAHSLQVSPDVGAYWLPALLRGSYVIDVDITGPRNGKAAILIADKRLDLSTSDKASSSGRLMIRSGGMVSMTFVLSGNAKVRLLDVKKVVLPNGGFEDWKDGGPVGFTVDPTNTPISRHTADKIEGDASLLMKVAKGSTAKLVTTFAPDGKSLKASCRIHLKGATKNDMIASLTVRFLDEAGKQVGKPMKGNEQRSGDEWTGLSVSTTVPPSAVKVELSVVVQSLDAAGEALVDGLQVED